MKPFDGLRVIDLSQVWAGPVAARVLADLGADVIKVERPTVPDRIRTAYIAQNDTTGNYWERAPYYTVRNVSKRGLALDLGSDEGIAILRGLLEDADVLIESYTPRVLENFGLSWNDLKEQYPRLIMMSLCGYGQTGPRRNSPAFGMGMEPASGISSVSGYAGEPPLKSGNTWVDPFAGIHGLGGLLTALYHRERSGRGQQIDVSMQEGLLQLLGPQFHDYWMNGRLHPGSGNRREGLVRGIYPCAGEDDWIAISVREEAQWAALASATGNEAWLGDDRLATMAGRHEQHDEIDAAIGEWTASRDKFTAMEELQGAGVPAGAVLNARELMQNEHLLARGLWDAQPVRGFATVPVQRYFPAHVDGEGYGARGPAPHIGEHTDEVLRELLGYDDAKIAELREAGVIDGEPIMLTPPESRAALIQPIDVFLESGSILEVDEQHLERMAAVVARIEAGAG